MSVSATASPVFDSRTESAGKASLGALMLGAIGVVFGDIGTSPLYTIKEAFSPHYGSRRTTPPCSGSCRSCSGRW